MQSLIDGVPGNHTSIQPVTMCQQAAEDFQV
jgi:hypothetical protein